MCVWVCGCVCVCVSVTCTLICIGQPPVRITHLLLHADSDMLTNRPCLHKAKTQIFPCGLASHLHEKTQLLSQKTIISKNSGQSGEFGKLSPTRWSLVCLTFLIGRLFAPSVGDTLPPAVFIIGVNRIIFTNEGGENSSF